LSNPDPYDIADLDIADLDIPDLDTLDPIWDVMLENSILNVYNISPELLLKLTKFKCYFTIAVIILFSFSSDWKPNYYNFLRLNFFSLFIDIEIERVPVT
jgi:hypothetical protein